MDVELLAWLLIIIGIVFLVLGLGGTVVLNLGHNVKIAGELGAVLIIIGVLLLIATTGLYHLLFSLPGVASASARFAGMRVVT